MINIYNEGVYYIDRASRPIKAQEAEKQGGGQLSQDTRAKAKKGTMAYKILESHNVSTDERGLSIKFDCLASHDITYVGIIQTIRAAKGDYKQFPIPYILSNCHNSMCAIGGTINADDHAFGLSAAKKYGGIFVPPHFAVIHQYMREMMAGCGKMIMGSDSHTRYGPLGVMGIGEGGGELVKQLLGKTYDIDCPQIVAVWLTGEPCPGVGPHDVALALIKSVFDSGMVKNKVLEFIGGGISGLSMDFRNGIDVMTTETTCLSSIWETDNTVKNWYEAHNRAGEFNKLTPDKHAYYDALIEIDLSRIKPMIALPYHPSNAYAIEELLGNLSEITGKCEFPLKDKISGNNISFDQGIIAGCAGGLYESINEAAAILGGRSLNTFPLSIYPASMPIYLSLADNGVLSGLTKSGAIIKTAFCGPCFGAGDIPATGGISARHTTRNFHNREGSKPNMGQNAAVALMDAKSIAATAVNGGKLTPATEEKSCSGVMYFFDGSIYEKNIFFGYKKPDAGVQLIKGPGIRDWPKMQVLANDILLKVAAYITDPVTTTDELIPSGETSSYRSNPMALAEHTLSRKDPDYVGRAKAAYMPESIRIAGDSPVGACGELASAIEIISKTHKIDPQNTEYGSIIYARRPGDGSAREQAASCQRVLGGLANIALEYATKRYRSNLINWGMLPFVAANEPELVIGDYIFVPGITGAIKNKSENIEAYIVREKLTPLPLSLPGLTEGEGEILLCGGLINYYGKV